MYSRLFTIFVTLVCATSSIASPVANDGVSLVARDHSLPLVGRDHVVPVDELLPRAALTATQALQQLSTQGTPFINNLKTAVANPNNVNAATVQTNLQGIITSLTTTQSQLQALSKGPIAAANQEDAATALLAFGPLITLLVGVLGEVVLIADVTVLTVVLPLVATIGTLLAAVISLAGGLIVGLLLGLVPVLLTLTGVLTTLGFTLILALITIL